MDTDSNSISIHIEACPLPVITQFSHIAISFFVAYIINLCTGGQVVSRYKRHDTQNLLHAATWLSKHAVKTTDLPLELAPCYTAFFLTALCSTIIYYPSLIKYYDICNTIYLAAKAIAAYIYITLRKTQPKTPSKIKLSLWGIILASQNGEQKKACFRGSSILNYPKCIIVEYLRIMLCYICHL